MAARAAALQSSHTVDPDRGLKWVVPVGCGANKGSELRDPASWSLVAVQQFSHPLRPCRLLIPVCYRYSVRVECVGSRAPASHAALVLILVQVPGHHGWPLSGPTNRDIWLMNG
jgi:hypothetical protein